MRFTFYAFLTVIVFLFFMACSQSTQYSSSSDNAAVTVQLNAPSSARTVYPDSWTYGSSSAVSKLYFAISAYTVSSLDPSDTTSTGSYYRNPADSSKLFTSVTYEQLKTTGLELNLSPAIWRITLSAYKTPVTENSMGAIANTDIVLTDTQYVTLSSGSRNITVSFTLTTPESDETGTFSAGLAFYPPDTFEMLTCELYRYVYTTDSVTGETTGRATGLADSATYNKADCMSESTGIENYAYYYYVNGGVSFEVSSGTYLFVAAFIDANGNYMARYPLYAVVAAGNKTSAEIVLHRAAFNSSPVNISNLALGSMLFNNGIEDVELESGVTMASKASHGLWQALEVGDTATDAFSASFTWKDNADNENGYYVQASSSTAGAAWTAWESIASLSPGSSSYSGTFQTGKRWKIRVKPHNDFSAVDGASAGGFDAWVESEPFGIFTVTYELTFTDSESTLHVASVRTAADAITSGSVVAFVLPYVYGASDNNTLLSTAAGYPYIVPPAAFASDYSLSWQSDGTTLSDIGGHAGDNITVWPVWTEN